MPYQSTLKTLICYSFLLLPATAVAWFHHSFFHDLMRGSHDIMGGKSDLPEGFQWVVHFGHCVYLVSMLVLVVCVFSLKFHSLRGPLWLSLCGGLLVMFCLLYCFLLVTPILSHGVYLGMY